MKILKNNNLFNESNPQPSHHTLVAWRHDGLSHYLNMLLMNKMVIVNIIITVLNMKLLIIWCIYSLVVVFYKDCKAAGTGIPHYIL